MKKAALHNLGCKVNAYETEAMQQLLEEAGYEIVSFHEKADVYVINTCSVTNMADRKSRQMLHRAKKMNPDAAVVAAGCYVQTKEEEAKQDLAAIFGSAITRKMSWCTDWANFLRNVKKRIRKMQRKNQIRIIRTKSRPWWISTMSRSVLRRCL